MDVQSGPGFAPAGWYQDPAGRHQLRYWDGLAWRDDVVDNGRQSADSLSQPSPPQTCESCQGQFWSGQRVVYYAGRRVWSLKLGVIPDTAYQVLQRSAVFLCEQCAQSPRKRDAAIKRKLACSSLGCTTYWRPPLPSIFTVQWLESTNYVRIREIMQDDLPTTQAPGDATLVFHWKGKSVIGDAALLIAVDDVDEGFGSCKRGFSARVRVPAGVHKVSVSLGGLRGSARIGTFEPGVTYEGDITRDAWGSIGFELRPVN